jgi:hypothetical protein
MDSSLSHDLTLSPPSGSGRSCTSALGRIPMVEERPEADIESWYIPLAI